MKLVEKPDMEIYEKTIQVELTIGELLILTALTGKSNNDKTKTKLLESAKTKGHEKLANEVFKKNMNYKLYTDLSNIVEELKL